MGNKKKQKKNEDSQKKISKKPKLEEQSLDDFLENWNESGDEGEGESANTAIRVEKSKEGKKQGKKKKKDNEKKDQTIEKEETGARAQKSYINSLQDKDREFYEFLKENDEELLNFDESSDDDDDDADKDEEGPVHELPDKLEVASDESDFEDEDDKEGPKKGKASEKLGRKLTQVHLDKWNDELEKQPNLGTLGEVIEAFCAAVATIGSGDEKSQESVKYVVEGGTIFNGVVRLCVVNLQPALKSILKISTDESHYKPEKAKKWSKVQRHVKAYIQELVKLMSRVSDPAAATVLLKHVHQLMPFIQAFPKGSKLILSQLVSTWCKGEETVRILSFMCVVRLVRK